MEVFSARLKWLRERRNFSQQDMADKLGLSQSYYGRFERNKGQPNLETLAKLPEILGESVDFMLGVTDFFKNAEMMYSKFENSSIALVSLTTDLKYLEINPNNPQIMSKDFNPDDPASVEDKINRIKKNLPLWKDQYKQLQDKLRSMLSEVPHVKESTLAKIEEGPWDALIIKDDEEGHL